MDFIVIPMLIQVVNSNCLTVAQQQYNTTVLLLRVACCSPSSRSHLCVQVLSSHLMHSSLPGLTRLEQMFLVALADTVATTSAEVPSSTDQQYTGQSMCLGK